MDRPTSAVGCSRSLEAPVRPGICKQVTKAARQWSKQTGLVLVLDHQERLWPGVGSLRLLADSSDTGELAHAQHILHVHSSGDTASKTDSSYK